MAPKKEDLRKAEAEYQAVMTGLRAKQEELQKLLDKLAVLERQLQVCGKGRCTYTSTSHS